VTQRGALPVPVVGETRTGLRVASGLLCVDETQQTTRNSQLATRN